MSSFVHLNLHSEYSLVDGIVRIKPLVKAASKQGMPAIALTDQSNQYAMVKFYKACIGAGIKPIIGADIWVSRDGGDENAFRLILLCLNHQGYLNLMALISESYLKGQHHDRAIVHFDWLKGRTEGLIALSGGKDGEIGRMLIQGHEQEAAETVKEWVSLFHNDYYLELTRVGRDGDEIHIHKAVQLALENDIPVVATNAVCFLDEDDFEAHEARVCIHDGYTLDDPTRPKNYTPEQYLRSPEEMVELFSDLPEAIENTIEIARRCNLEVVLGKNFLPEFPIPEGFTTDDYLIHRSEVGLEERLPILFDPQSEDYEQKCQAYRERLKIELDVIIQMGFPGYFLIVADFIQWAKDNDVPVGPGRGSGAGSLVAYALKITDLDPLQYDLLFERFLNPERVSMPDFDVDFCMEKRDRVIAYVTEKYGRNSVSQIATHGTMAAKAVVRDVGRVLGHPYGFVDKIAKLIPFEIGITLDKALEQEADLRQRYNDEEDVRYLIDLAKKLEGVARNVGKHAGGVVIAPTQLIDFSPLYCEEDGTSVVTQYDKNDVEEVGLVKFDFLGLRTLTIIDWAVKAINKVKQTANEKPVDITLIPLDDKPSFDLLKRADTTAVFQLESSGMKKLIKRLQPDNFEDIVALVALYRPGPLGSGMVDDFIDRKHGVAAVDYPHPDLEPILKPTYGIILYQEQVMQVAQVLAGYSLGGADLLRRAMGKKKPEEMQKQRSIFQEGSLSRGVDPEVATHIFDLMEKFAEYGFNKSHSAAYALVSYQTAWLKAHYPSYFMAAVLSSDMDNTDKVVGFIEDCRLQGLEVVPPDVNRSFYMFVASSDQQILYGLGAIKGVGEGVIQGIVAEREENGPYRDLYEFCRRIDLHKANRRVLEAMIKAGALDYLGENRATMINRLEEAIKQAEQYVKNSAVGQNDMFGFSAAPAESEAPQESGHHSPPVKEWEEFQRLMYEKETLGLYLTGHPITQFESELEAIHVQRLKDVTSMTGSGGSRRENRTVKIAGLVIDVRTFLKPSGKMAFLTLDDRTERLEVTVFPDVFERDRERIVKDQIVVVEGSLKYNSFREQTQISAERILRIENARETYARGIILKIDQSQTGNGFVNHLREAMSPYMPGNCRIRIEYQSDQGCAVLDLGADWQVRPSEELIKRLGEFSNVQVVY